MVRTRSQQLVRATSRAVSSQTPRVIRVARGVQTVARYGRYAATAYRAARGISRFLSGSSQAKNADGAPSTSTGTYKQFANSYRKKRITRKGKRNIREIRQFKRIWSKVQGLKSMTLTNKQVFTTTNDQQVVDGVVGLYGLNQNTGSDYGFSDIYKIKWAVTGTSDPGQKQRFQVNRCVLDIWIKNVGETTAFVDLYEYVLRKDIEDTLGTNLFQVFQNLYNSSVRVVGTQELITNLGWSPFEVSDICSRFLILKVDRMQIPPGGNMSFHRKYNKPYTPSVSDLSQNNGGYTGRKGHFRGFFARVAGDQTSTLQAEACDVSFLTRRTYYYSTLYDTYNDQGSAIPLVP